MIQKLSWGFFYPQLKYVLVVTYSEAVVVTSEEAVVVSIVIPEQTITQYFAKLGYNLLPIPRYRDGNSRNYHYTYHSLI